MMIGLYVWQDMSVVESFFYCSEMEDSGFRGGICQECTMGQRISITAGDSSEFLLGARANPRFGR